MEYSLWDVQTNSYLGRFQDEKEALLLVRTLVNHYGPKYAEILDLGAITDEGEVLEPLSGAALIRRAEEVLAGGEQGTDRRGEVIASSGRRRGFGEREPMAAAGKVWHKSREIRHSLKQSLKGRASPATPSQAQRVKKP